MTHPGTGTMSHAETEIYSGLLVPTVMAWALTQLVPKLMQASHHAAKEHPLLVAHAFEIQNIFACLLAIHAVMPPLLFCLTLHRAGRKIKVH